MTYRATVMHHSHCHHLVEVKECLHRIVYDANDSCINMSAALIRLDRSDHSQVMVGKAELQVRQKY